ncbi:MAG: hypothetical protein M1294_15645 [Firmicutes bacterium]|jgi:hypothetical protein|uniref:Uncharacterized protein n=1 Tax=Sulfobacillus benefaciens TaxID=453960 RepID=A0A2T2WUI3_9FIRM|nr:hypothetical protein [Bacillota bacterium]PSR25883.1 MAG: hypothetical protein C7B43_15930 [Sulfobacillus benefaciens]
MMVVVAATTVAAGTNIHILGELPLLLLLFALVLRDVMASSKTGATLEVRRSLSVVITPLAIAVAVVLLQQIAVFFR